MDVSLTNGGGRGGEKEQVKGRREERTYKGREGDIRMGRSAELYDSFLTPTNGGWTNRTESRGTSDEMRPRGETVRLLTPLALNSLMTYAALYCSTAVHLTIPLPRHAPDRRRFVNLYSTVSTLHRFYPPPRYSPSTATFACQIPSRRTSLNIAGAGTISTNATGTSTISSNESSIVIPGLITRK